MPYKNPKNHGKRLTERYNTDPEYKSRTQKRNRRNKQIRYQNDGGKIREQSRVYSNKKYNTDEEYRENKKTSNNKNYRKNTLTYLLSNAKRHARMLGQEFTITKADLPPIPNVSPIFGTPFEIGTPNALSIDRIDSRKGYVPGNIGWLSRRENTMKNDMTIEEIKIFATKILNYIGE